MKDCAYPKCGMLIVLVAKYAEFGIEEITAVVRSTLGLADGGCCAYDTWRNLQV